MSAAAGTGGLPPRADVLVLVGTDHHRFDRLVGWVDDWLRGRDDAPAVLVQHGSSAAPSVAQGRALLPHAELQALMRGATAVVTHGGPATITEVRRAGRRPIVVPRDPSRGEHVDGHQQRFSRRMGAEGLVALCEDRAALLAALEAALADPASTVVDAGAEQARVERAAAKLGEVLDELAAAPRRRRWGRAR